MAESTMTPADAPKKRSTKKKIDDAVMAATASAETAAETAKGRFSKAIEDAKASAETLKGEALEKGAALAVEGKTRASDALGTLGKTISDTAATIDEKLGVQYGDYARSAARSIQETAAKLEAKDLGELGDDVKEFVRKSPGVAIGVAAIAGFAIARLLSGGSDD